jgi:hypothetical protein
MPIMIDLEDPNFRENVINILNSTIIRITGQGVLM